MTKVIELIGHFEDGSSVIFPVDDENSAKDLFDFIVKNLPTDNAQYTIKLKLISDN